MIWGTPILIWEPSDWRFKPKPKPSDWLLKKLKRGLRKPSKIVWMFESRTQLLPGEHICGIAVWKSYENMWWNQVCSFLFPWNGPWTILQWSKLLGICCASSPGLELTFVATLGCRLRRSDNLRAADRMDHSVTGCPIWAGEQSKMSLLEPKGEEAIRLKDPTSQVSIMNFHHGAQT